MKLGEKIKIPFAKREIEGTVVKLFTNTVYLQADFKNHPGKIIKRKIKRVEKADKKSTKKVKKK